MRTCTACQTFEPAVAPSPEAGASYSTIEECQPARGASRVVRLRHRAVVERSVERLLVDAGLAGDLAQGAA
jgi:hypothetical protein